MTSLEGYELEGGWTSVARGAFAIGNKGGKRYFIKRLPQPKYPCDKTLFPPGSDTTKRLLKSCEQFEKQLKDKIAALKKAHAICDLLIYPEEFFRVKQNYYLVSAAIDGKSLEPEEVCKLPQADKYSIMRQFATALTALDSINMVHGDIKPSNVFIVKVGKSYKPLLIDFDDCYFSGRPPEPDATVGSPEFYSPELGSYISKKDPARGNIVTCASDTFAAAILFYQYQTGEALRPKKTDGHIYPFQVFAEDMEFGRVDESFRSLLIAMLEVQASDRPKIKDVPGLIDTVEKGGRITSKTSDMILVRRDEKKVFVVMGKKKHSATPASALEYAGEYGLNIVDEGGESISEVEFKDLFGITGSVKKKETDPEPTPADYILIKGTKYYIIKGGKRLSSPKSIAIYTANKDGLKYFDESGTELDSEGNPIGEPPEPTEPVAEYILVKNNKYYMIKDGKKLSTTKTTALEYSKEKGLKFMDEEGKEITIE